MPMANARERKALEILIGTQWKFEPQLGAGPRTLAHMFDMGWVEHVPGQDRCIRITDAGRAAFHASAPKPSRSQLRARLVDPLLRTVTSG
jgi:hypothetical protein